MKKQKKYVHFCLTAPIAEPTDAEAVAALRPLIESLRKKAEMLGLDVVEGNLMGSFSYSQTTAMANLAIPKIKGVTYEQIFGLVNSVQIVSFRVF